MTLKSFKEPKDTDLIAMEKLMLYTGLPSHFWRSRLNSTWCPPYKITEREIRFVWKDVKDWLDLEMRIKGINR